MFVDILHFLSFLSGLFVAGALNSGRIFIWNKRSATVKLTAVLDKIRNVQPGTSKFHFFLHFLHSLQ